jgi:hypothetical protein
MMKLMRVGKVKIQCQCLKSIIDCAYIRPVEMSDVDTEVIW